MLGRTSRKKTPKKVEPAPPAELSSELKNAVGAVQGFAVSRSLIQQGIFPGRLHREIATALHFLDVLEQDARQKLMDTPGYAEAFEAGK